MKGGKAVPTRYIRSEQAKQAKIASEVEEAGGGKHLSYIIDKPSITNIQLFPFYSEIYQCLSTVINWTNNYNFFTKLCFYVYCI